MKLNDVFAEDTQSHATKYLDYAEDMFSRDDLNYISNGIEDLSTYLERGGDENLAIAMLDRVKDNIIKNILITIREGAMLFAAIVVDDLRGLGVSWPELAAIKKSFHADKLIDEDFEDQSEGGIYYRLQQYLDLSNIWLVLNKVYEYEIDLDKNPMVRRMFNEHKDFIIKELLEDVKSGDYEHDLFQWRFEALQKIGIDWPELAIISRSIRNNYKSVIDEVIADDVPIEHTWTRSSTDLYDNIKAVFQFGGIWKVVEWMASSGYDFDDVPQVREMFEERKDRIIKELLQNIREGDMGYANRRIGSLFDIGVNWQELRMILRSIIAAKAEREARRQATHESESLADIHKDVYEMLKKNAELRGIWYVMRRIAEWDLAKKIPQVLDIVDEHKTEIVTRILKNVKEGDVGYSVATTWINNLKEIGVKWPELDIIRKSILAVDAGKDVEQTQINEVRDLNSASKTVQLAAVQENGNAIRHIKKPSEAVQLAAVQENGHAIRHIKKPSKEVQLAAVQENGNTIVNIKNPASKAVVLIAILKMIKNNSLHIGLYEKYRKIYPDWPEWAVIDRSLKANKETGQFFDKELDETIDRGTFATDFEGIVGAIKSKRWYRAEDWLYRLRDWYEWHEVIQTLGTYLEPEFVRPYFEHTKTDIMHDILGAIKDNYLGDARNALSGLEKSGVAWPELAIIKRSLDAEKARTTVTEDDDFSQEDFIKEAIPRLFRQFNPGAALNIINAHYKADPNNVKWLRKNIAPILRKNKNKLRAWVLDSANAVIMGRVASADKLLKELGVNLPEIKTIIDDNKDHIIKRYLQVIQNHGSADAVIQDVINLRKLGVTWPELDIIERSSKADIKEDENSRRQYDIDSLIGEIELHLSNGDSAFITWMYRLKHYDALPQVKPIIEKYKQKVIKYANETAQAGKVTYIFELQDLLRGVGVDIPEVDNVFERNKDVIIKNILKKVKAGHKDTPERIIKHLSLDKVGVKWPELAVIKRSLEAEKKRLGPPDHED